MSEDTDILLKLLTGGEKDHVRILCEDGEVRINTFILGALSAILKNIMMSLEESNVSLGEKIFLFEELKKKDLLVLFQCLFQQVTEFCPPPKLMEMVQSFLFSEEMDTTINGENEEENMDSTCILDDHDYVDQQKPVVIPIKRSQNNFAAEQEKPSLLGFYECHICHVKIPSPQVKGVGRPGMDTFLKIENEHLSSVHGFQLLQKCFICQTSCADVEKHLERGHPDKKCHICGRFVNSKKRLEIHVSMHKKMKARELAAKEEKICPHCGKVFQNTIRLNEHIKRACIASHEETTCEECGKTFKNPYGHRAHVLEKHSGKERSQYICNICGKILHSKGSLSAHHKAIHGIRELNIKCELCGKLFAEKFCLKKHMETVHTEKEACPICGFKTHNMKNHNKTVHTKDEDKEFQCQECGKGFVERQHLERHKISMHLKTKPYNCRYGCDISYSDFSNRNAHERKTHGKLFLNIREQRLKEKIEMLGVDVDTLPNPIDQYV